MTIVPNLTWCRPEKESLRDNWPAPICDWCESHSPVIKNGLCANSVIQHGYYSSIHMHYLCAWEVIRVASVVFGKGNEAVLQRILGTRY